MWSRAYARHWHGDHERGIAGFHPDWNLDGLDFATAHPTIEAAEFIWNDLLPRLEHHHLWEGPIIDALFRRPTQRNMF